MLHSRQVFQKILNAIVCFDSIESEAESSDPTICQPWKPAGNQSPEAVKGDNEKE